MSREPFFLATNHHSESCGVPPTFDDRLDDDITYRSYFENQYGEQWVLVHRASTDAVTLYGGDCGWENALAVLPLKEADRRGRRRAGKLERRRATVGGGLPHSPAPQEA